MPLAKVNGDVLGAHYRIVVYNCRGYPPSTVPLDLSDYSQEASIEDLRQLLDHLGIERAALGGFSMGGSIALNFTLTFPDRVRALILAGTGTGSADKQQFTREFSPIADRLVHEGVQRVAEDYLRGSSMPTSWSCRREDWPTRCAAFSCAVPPCTSSRPGCASSGYRRS
jgi:pimeloyl-ACP methyl ester carboxylesterase